MFVDKFWSSGKTDPSKGQHGKMFQLLRRDTPILFLRTKTFHKGGVMSRHGSWDAKTRAVEVQETRNVRLERFESR